MAKLVGVIASTGTKTLGTRNILSAPEANTSHPVYAQTTMPVPGVHKTFQDSGGRVAGLKTIIIPGYTGNQAGTPIISQNWDGVTAPAIPAGWTLVGGPAVTSTTLANSSPNSLKFPVSNANAFALTPATDTNNGDVTVSSNVLFVNTTLAQTLGVVARAGNLTPTNYYRAMINYGASSSPRGVVIVKNVAGTVTTIASLATTTAFSNGAWFTLMLTCIGTSLSASVQRVSDGMWLSAVGAWQVGQTACLTVIDSSVTGAGYCGCYAFLGSGSNVAYEDDFAVVTSD